MRLRTDLPRRIRLVANAWLAGEILFLGLTLGYVFLITTQGFRASFSFLTPLVEAWPTVLWILGVPLAALTMLALLGALAGWLAWIPLVTTLVGSRGRWALLRGARSDFLTSNAGGVGVPVYHLVLMTLFLAYVIGNLDYAYGLRWARWLYLALLVPVGAIATLLSGRTRRWLGDHAEESLVARGERA